MLKVFTSESVTNGHPDKICDQIADAILDAIIAQDPQARVACEVVCTTGMVLLMGEITTNFTPDYPKIVREVIKEIGYNKSSYGFDYQTCAVLTSFDQQSADIAQGVNQAENKYQELGAGDQGIMFGYACNETAELMPLPATLAHRLTQKLTEVRQNQTIDYLRPDGKSQVSIEYKDDLPHRVTAIVLSAQHDPHVDLATIKHDLIEKVIKPVIPAELLDDNTKYFINSTGKFIQGGPYADSGLTGRKIIVDTYGGMAAHGGGAFSGKDPTKVDRSGSYMARYVAKNIVAAGLATKCQIQLSYAIGVADIISLNVDTFGTGVIDDEKIANIILKTFDFRLSSIIRELDLQKPIYRKLAVGGHFGREELSLKFEQTDKVSLLQQHLQALQNN